MQSKRDQGRLNWVFNILEGRTEQEDVMYREGFASHPDVSAKDEGFLLLPDLNWDRKTVGSLHLLGLVERRDIWSVRDLKNKHVVWLKHMRERLVDATVKLYPDLDRDQLKLYVHCQYHHALPCSNPRYLVYSSKHRASILNLGCRSTHILPFPHPHCPRGA